MPKFGKTSLKNLASCNPDLQDLCRALIRHADFSVVYGHRTEAEQLVAFRSGKSTVQWPNSKHNARPSLAVDIVPYEDKALWGKTKKELLAIGRLIGRAEQIAQELGIKIRCGLDWDQDGQVTDTKFVDAFHIELSEES